MLGEDAPIEQVAVEQDPWCLASIRHVASLAPIARQSRKPMFDLRRADGIGSGQIQAVDRCRIGFEHLLQKLVEKVLQG